MPFKPSLTPRPTRRQLLQVLGLGAAGSVLPGCNHPPAAAPPPAAGPVPTFLTAEERTQLAALADYVLPPDDQPGGSALGAVPYIENLLTALEYPFPRIFLGGPYSGRVPYPSPHGNPTANYPAADYLTYRPPTRLQLRAWQLYLYGSDGVPGGGPNDAALGKVVGLRNQIRSGLQAAAALAPKPLEQLTYAELDKLWLQLDGTFASTLVELVAEAAFGAPEYGGNPDGQGWAMVRYEGDILPLGFSYTDPVSGESRDNPDRPTSVAQPGPDPQPLSEESISFLREVFDALGGQEFT
jgi:hypothetical protein